MWRSIKSGSITSSANNAGQRSRSGTFAICAGDQDTLEAPFRMPKRIGQNAHVLKVKFTIAGQLVAQGEQLLNG
jgi:hypothetical protein